MYIRNVSIIIEKGATADGSPDNYVWLRITAQVSRLGAVIFASWNRVAHARNQDYIKSHTVQALR